jgi:hypothetical protein
MYFYFLYIDPGSGSYLIQAIIAAVLGVVVYFKNIRAQIRSFFSRKKKDEVPPKDS